MSGESNPFRDEHAAPQLDQRLPQVELDPYRSPSAESVPPSEGTGASARPGRLRISPTWAILIGQTPLYGIFATLVVTTNAGLPTEGVGFLFQAATSELSVFNARTLFCGPGAVVSRVSTTLVCLFVAVFLIALLPSFTGVDSLRRMSIATLAPVFVTFAIAALPVSAAAALGGSRDRRIPEMVGARDRGALALAGFLAAVVCYALFLRGFDWSSFRIHTDGLLVSALGYSSAMFVLLQTWRIGVRGIRRLISVATALCALCSVVTAVWFGFLVYQMSIDPEFTPQYVILHGVAFVAIPIGRELLFRLAGYRAINLYAERRRARRTATASTSDRP